MELFAAGDSNYVKEAPESLQLRVDSTSASYSR